MFSIKNRQARYEFFIHSTLEAGIVLTGSEVKSLRLGQGNIADSYVVEKNGEIFLQNASIAPYRFAFRGEEQNYDPYRLRKLLLHKKEIRKYVGYITKKGMTIIPLSMYSNKRGVVKVEIGLAQGKKLYDKRATEKEREWNRDKAKIMKDSF